MEVQIAIRAGKSRKWYCVPSPISVVTIAPSPPISATEPALRAGTPYRRILFVVGARLTKPF